MSDNSVLTVLNRGVYLQGTIRPDGWFYFKHNGVDAKVHSSLITQGILSNYYVKTSSNIRNQNLSVVGTKSAGEVVRGIELNNGYVRFTDGGEIRFIYKSQVTTNPVKGHAYIVSDANIRDAKSGNVVGVLPTGSYINGIEKLDRWIYFIHNGKEVKVHKSLIVYGINQNYEIKSAANIRNQHLSVIGIKEKGSKIRAVDLGPNSNYLRFVENYKVYLIHKSMVK